ncbi:MAG: hypothetical protein JNL11_06005 [Bdellovibrionaceae bacterium]|nr:hypothetical protein [Pseudobdellovibrionaceae bacterium]
MKKSYFAKTNILREKIFPRALRVPTEYQILTWENEGGCLDGRCNNIMIVNGILCETWFDRIKATLMPYWRRFRVFFRNNQQNA